MKLVLSLLAVSLVLFSALAVFPDIFISYQSGECRVDMDGNGRWVKAAPDMELNARSTVRTGRDGELEILFDDETVSVGNNSTVKISELQAQLTEKKKSGWLTSVSKYTKTFTRGEEKHTRRWADLDILCLMPSSKTGREWMARINSETDRDADCDILANTE